MEKTQQIEGIVAPSLDAMGYRVVRVQLSGGMRPNLQIMAERNDGRSMSADDCAEISRAVSALLDVEDPIPTTYMLEVSSPGIDRPLVKAGDFRRFAGEIARIETRIPIDGRKRFQGRLLGIEGGTVRMVLPDAEVALPFSDIAKAKLVITDELLAAAKRQQEERV